MTKYTVKRQVTIDKKITPLQYLLEEILIDDNTIHPHLYEQCRRELEMLRKVLIIMRGRLDDSEFKTAVISLIDYKDIRRALGEEEEA